MKPDNLLFLSLKDQPALAEMLKTMSPGDGLDFTLTNGTGTVKGKLVIDELLPDRVSGRLEDIEVEGVEAPEVDAEEEAEPPKAGVMGASVLGVMAAKKT